MRQTLFILLCFSLLHIAVYVQSAEPEKITDILILLDCSKHMSVKWDEGTRLDAIRSVLEPTFDSATQSASWGLNVGIRVFGEQSLSEKRNCEDTRLAVPIEWLDPITLKKVLDGLKPQGLCNFVRAAESSSPDFLRKPSDGNRNCMILILSHADECGGDISATFKEILKSTLSSGSLSVIGLKLEPNSANQLKTVLDSLTIPFINVQTKPEFVDGFSRVFNEMAGIAPASIK